MNLGTFFYIILVSLVIVVGTVYFTKRKKRLPYTFNSKKKLGMTNIDKMLSNIKYQELPSTENKAEEPNEKKETGHTEHVEHHKTTKNVPEKHENK